MKTKAIEPDSRFWNCRCKRKFMHRRDTHFWCRNCRAFAVDMPDSRIDDLETTDALCICMAKTNAQLGRIFGLAKPLNCSKEDLEDLAFEITNGRVERLSALNFDEANAMIERLGGSPVSKTPGRTLRHRRAKAGAVQIASHAQIAMLRKIAEKRGITEEGLERLCRRMLRGQPRPRTTAEANKIIEAIKAMNRRDADNGRAAA